MVFALFKLQGHSAIKVKLVLIIWQIAQNNSKSQASIDLLCRTEQMFSLGSSISMHGCYSNITFNLKNMRRFYASDGLCEVA